MVASHWPSVPTTKSTCEMGGWKNLQKISAELSELVMHVRTSTVTISGMNSDLTGGGSGSGWVYDSSGHVVTNHHVVDGLAGTIRVKPSGRPELVGTLVGTDPENDLAVLHVEHLAAPPIPIRHGPAMLGELCVALGSPLGLRESASLGIVSGLSRQLPRQEGQPIEEVIQTDASISPGNSGGPLVDVGGFLLGVNTAIRTDGQGIGFAVPGEVVMDVVPELIRFGAVQRASLGISVASEWVNAGGIDRMSVSVKRVAKADSPFRPGDVLESIGHVSVHRRYDVRKVLCRDQVGRVLNVKVQRDGQIVEFGVRADPR